MYLWKAVVMCYFESVIGLLLCCVPLLMQILPIWNTFLLLLLLLLIVIAHALLLCCVPLTFLDRREDAHVDVLIAQSTGLILIISKDSFIAS